MAEAHQASLRQLKLRREHEERERIREQMAEDRERRANRAAAATTQRAEQPVRASASTAGATATVLVRCPDGVARRGTFAADATLAPTLLES